MVERSRWHPLLAAQEGPTDTWSLADAFDRVYGTIELRPRERHRPPLPCQLPGRGHRLVHNPPRRV